MRGRRSDGFTLMEVLVAVGILAMVSAMVYGSLSVTLRSQRLVMKTQEVYHQGRVALSRMARDLSCAFLSKHVGVLERVTETLFRGGSDELVFTYLCHTRIYPTRPESDQGVVSYFLKSGQGRGKVLVRREKAWIDERADREGDEQILAEGVKDLDIEYWDAEQEDWTDSWKAELEDMEPVIQDAGERKTREVLTELVTGQEVEDEFRLPSRMRITLVLLDEWGEDYTFETQVELRLREAFQW